MFKYQNEDILTPEVEEEDKLPDPEEIEFEPEEEEESTE